MNSEQPAQLHHGHVMPSARVPSAQAMYAYVHARNITVLSSFDPDHADWASSRAPSLRKKGRVRLCLVAPPKDSGSLRHLLLH